MANSLMDFKNTHLHSHINMSKDCLSNPFTHVVKKLNQEYLNGWHAAQIECQRIKLIQEDKTQQKKINEQRVVDRGHVAIFKTIVEQVFFIIIVKHDFKLQTTNSTCNLSFSMFNNRFFNQC